MLELTKGSLKKSANCCNVVRSCLVLLDWHTAVWKVWYIIQCCTVWFDIGTFKGRVSQNIFPLVMTYENSQFVFITSERGQDHILIFTHFLGVSTLKLLSSNEEIDDDRRLSFFTTFTDHIVSKLLNFFPNLGPFLPFLNYEMRKCRM